MKTKARFRGFEAAARGLDPLVLLSVALILVVAKVGGEIFERLHQPAVLGELIGGIVVGNLTLVTPFALEWSFKRRGGTETFEQ
ncbi:MAG: hypothetical protein ACR2LC_06320 [Pyrinomonadaceae bacterium]